MANNLYQFSGIENVNNPNIPAFERTSSFKYKGEIANGSANDAAILWTNADVVSLKGVSIWVYNSGASASFKNRLYLQMIGTGAPKLTVRSSAIFTEGVLKQIELDYNGSSLASGVSLIIDGVTESLETIDDSLATSILNANDWRIGLWHLDTLSGDFVLGGCEFWIDAVQQFETDCANNDPTCVDLSAQGNDGTVDRSTSTEEEFYITYLFGEKYRYYFNWDNNSANTRYKVSILKVGYEGSVTTLVPTATPWIQDIKGQLDTFEKPILGSSAKFEVITEGPGYTDYDDDFLNSNYKDFIVKLIEDPDGASIIRWVGILQPEIASRNWVGYVKTYSLSAVDGLADLKNKKYSTDGTDAGSTYNGLDNMLSIIQKALGKVADIAELQLNFRIQLGTYSDQMTDTENAFEENEIAQELFFVSEDGETKFDSCYDVLQKILAPFYCNMSQANGYYWIWCNGEDNSYYFEYNWALALQSRTNHIRSVNISDYKDIGQGSLYKKGPYRDFNVRLYNKTYDPELITNGGFDSDITGWSNGDADDSSNQWTNIGRIFLPPSNGVLGAVYTGAASSASYHVHTSTSFQLDVSATAERVNVSVQIQYVSSTPDVISNSNVRIRLWNSTDGYGIGFKGYQSIENKGSFITFTENLDVTGYTDTTNYLDIEVQVTDATTEDLLIYIDNVSVKQEADNTPVDWLHSGARATQLIIKEQIVYIADKQESNNDLCAIKDAGGTYTTTWDRYLKSGDDIPLIRTLQQYTFNSNRRYMSFTKATIHDPDETIDTFNVLSNDDGDFRIIGMQKDYYHARVKVDLIEVIFSILFIIDTPFSVSSSKLGTQYGDDIV